MFPPNHTWTQKFSKWNMLKQRYFVQEGTWGDLPSFPHFDIKITKCQKDILELHSCFLKSSSWRNATVAPLLLTGVYIVDLEDIPFLRATKAQRNMRQCLLAPTPTGTYSTREWIQPVLELKAPLDFTVQLPDFVGEEKETLSGRRSDLLNIIHISQGSSYCEAFTLFLSHLSVFPSIYEQHSHHHVFMYQT